MIHQLNCFVFEDFIKTDMEDHLFLHFLLSLLHQ
jgi:hypothetical protein